MTITRYFPSEQPHAVALRIGPHALSQWLYTWHSYYRSSVECGRNANRPSRGWRVTLALAVVAGKGVANDQYLRPVVATNLAIALGVVTISSVTIVNYPTLLRSGR